MKVTRGRAPATPGRAATEVVVEPPSTDGPPRRQRRGQPGVQTSSADRGGQQHPTGLTDRRPALRVDGQPWIGTGSLLHLEGAPRSVLRCLSQDTSSQVRGTFHVCGTLPG